MGGGDGDGEIVVVAADDLSGILSTCPTKISRDLPILLAAATSATRKPFAFAMSYRVSPSLTMYCTVFPFLPPTPPPLRAAICDDCVCDAPPPMVLLVLPVVRSLFLPPPKNPPPPVFVDAAGVIVLTCDAGAASSPSLFAS